MIDVALLSVIRRWHFREGKGIREIARRTGLSRNTVRKYLSSGDIEPRYPELDGTNNKVRDIREFEISRIKYLENRWLGPRNQFDI